MSFFDRPIDDMPRDEIDLIARAVEASDDYEAMCLLGEANERLSGSAITARGWYELAAGDGHVPAMLALARLAAEREDQDAVSTWLGRATDAAGGPVVGPAFDALGYDSFGVPIGLDSDDCNEGGASFTVVVADPPRAAAVLEPLLPMFARVDADGSILTDEQLTKNDDLTPNWIAPLEVGATTVTVIMDTKGEMMAAMGRTYVRLISDTLVAAGITAQIAGPRDPLPGPEDDPAQALP